MAYWYRRVFLLAIPLILSSLTQPLLSTVDTILSGHLPGAAALGGVAVDGIFIGATRVRDLRDSMLISFLGFLVLEILLERWLGNHGLWCAMLRFMILRAITLATRLPGIEKVFAAPTPVIA